MGQHNSRLNNSISVFWTFWHTWCDVSHIMYAARHMNLDLLLLSARFFAWSHIGRGSSALYKHPVVFLGKEISYRASHGSSSCSWHRLAHPEMYLLNRIFSKIHPLIKKLISWGSLVNIDDKTLDDVSKNACKHGGLVSWHRVIHQTENQDMD